jgi:hypothetical protein
MIDAQFTLEEFYEALLGLGKNKVHGPDVVPAEFFITFWEVLGLVVRDALNAGIINRHYSKKFLKSMIALLHKKGEKTVLKKKHGISLSNVV